MTVSKKPALGLRGCLMVVLVYGLASAGWAQTKPQKVLYAFLTVRLVDPSGRPYKTDEPELR